MKISNKNLNKISKIYFWVFVVYLFCISPFGNIVSDINMLTTINIALVIVSLFYSVFILTIFSKIIKNFKTKGMNNQFTGFSKITFVLWTFTITWQLALATGFSQVNFQKQLGFFSIHKDLTSDLFAAQSVLSAILALIFIVSLVLLIVLNKTYNFVLKQSNTPIWPLQFFVTFLIEKAKNVDNNQIIKEGKILTKIVNVFKNIKLANLKTELTVNSMATLTLKATKKGMTPPQDYLF